MVCSCLPMDLFPTVVCARFPAHPVNRFGGPLAHGLSLCGKAEGKEKLELQAIATDNAQNLVDAVAYDYIDERLKLKAMFMTILTRHNIVYVNIVYDYIDEVYDYIHGRLKLKARSEKTSLCAKKRPGVKAGVLMATPCTK